MTHPPKLTPKRQALQESGTINTHAAVVHDSAFVGSEFFDPHDLVQVRYEMLRRVSSEGLSITDAVARFGVTRPTFYKAQADFARAPAWWGCCRPSAGPMDPTRSPMRSCASSSSLARMTRNRMAPPWSSASTSTSAWPFTDAPSNARWRGRKKNAAELRRRQCRFSRACSAL